MSNTDFNDIKKGIKRVEYDKIKYDVNIFLGFIASVLVGCGVGVLFGAVLGWISGVIILIVSGLYSFNTYYEVDKKIDVKKETIMSINKICPKCKSTFDGTWKVCLSCRTPLVDND